jgi:glucose-6-phosphate isomerase
MENSQSLWSRYTSLFQEYPEVGIALDISRMRFDSDFLGQMKPRVEKAFEDMQALEKGEIANPDENRMVGHYWLRTPELSPTAEIKSDIEQAIDKMRKFTAAVHSGDISPQTASKFKNVLLVGIGGSALGPQLVDDALGSEADKVKLYYSDNTDPDGIARTLTEIGDGLNETLCIIISKSGGTVETRNGLLEAQAAFSAKDLDFSRHVVAVTCPNSKLDKQAQSDKWLSQFYIWDWVGGRTSLFSAVGLLPALLQGINIDEFLSGARQMDELTRKADPASNPAALMAQMWYAAGDGQGKKDMVVLPYKDRLCLFSKYLQQLVMESLGKEKDLDGKIVNQGLAVYGNKGSTDQHAYVQQLRDGLNNFFATFIEVLKDSSVSEKNISSLEVEEGLTSGDYLSGFFQGTRRALYEGGRDSMTITIDELSPHSLGALIALFERAVGLYASLINVNAYHQPGVEAGKKAAVKVVELQKKLLAKMSDSADKKPATALELSAAIGEDDNVETVYKILEHLSANPNRGIKRVTESRNPIEAKYK